MDSNIDTRGKMPCGRGKPQPQIFGNDRYVVERVAIAVAIVLRRGEDALGMEIWDTLGYEFVPDFVDEYDAKPIRKALKQWNKRK